MNMGVPVIASDVGGLSEIFSGDASGLLVANEPQEIAGAMRRLLDESALAEVLISRARARIAAGFTKQHLVTGTLSSYERALAG